MDRRSFLVTTLTGLPAIMIAGSARSLFAGSLSDKTFLPFEWQDLNPVDAETIYGRVRGYMFNDVAIFRGIPYGGPTEGPGRFLPPSKPEKWTGVKDAATTNGPRCVQQPGAAITASFKIFGGGRSDAAELSRQTDSENCLNLNVLTPGLKGKRPVMVYIHGGGFTTGSSVLTVLSDRHVREQDVVLVGVNHRLNVFGFTYLGGLSEKYAVGNPGLLDLIAALEWVRDNIENFGGDPDNVMIFGESGGGAKISTLLAMPAASGLFHKAAIQSGSYFRATTAEAATKAAREMMDKLGLTNVEDLQKVPTSDLFRAGISRDLLGAGPVIDGHTLMRHPWDPDSPEISAHIPLLIGNDKDEMTLFSLSNQKLFDLDEAGLREELVKTNIPEDRVDAVIAVYKKNHPQETPSDLFFRISTDRGARFNAARQAELHLSRGKAKVFMYYCQWNTPEFGGKIRAFHTSDLPLTMRLVAYPESEQLSRQLSGAWAAFARNSDPSQQGLKWPAYTLKKRSTMVFDASASGAIKDPHREERIMIKDIPSGSIL